MLNLNRVEVIGNLTRDPELRFTQNQQAVCSFAVATNRRYKDQSGNWTDATPEYHDVSVWGQLGERCSQVLKKGDRIYVSGRLQSRSWEAPDGAKRTKTEIVADSIIGPDQVNKNLRSGAESAFGDDFADATPASPSKTGSKKNSAPVEEINIDDIPF